MKKFSDAIGVESIPPLDSRGRIIRSPEIIYARARQLGHFMGRVQAFYMNDLGLDRVDTDPSPGPNHGIGLRMEHLHRAGPLSKAPLHYLGAFSLGELGQTSRSDDGMQGLLVLRNHSSPGPANQPRVEIVEWDTLDHGGSGLGRFMLREGMAQIHPDSVVFADVAEPNLRAWSIYEHYGFWRDGDRPIRHGVFDVDHYRMITSGHALQHALGITK